MKLMTIPSRTRWTQNSSRNCLLSENDTVGPMNSCRQRNVTNTILVHTTCWEYVYMYTTSLVPRPSRYEANIQHALNVYKYNDNRDFRKRLQCNTIHNPRQLLSEKQPSYQCRYIHVHAAQLVENDIYSKVKQKPFNRIYTYT